MDQYVAPNHEAIIASRTQLYGAQVEDQIVLVLVGLPGSSKSTFSNALVYHSHSATWIESAGHISGDDQSSNREALGSTSETSSGGVSHDGQVQLRRRVWTRVSQDESPNRRRQECEAALREALQRGENVVVDRVNFDPTQRAHFVHIAETHSPRPRIWALTLQVSDQTLRQRLENRSWHPTIPDAQTGHRVLSAMQATFSPPDPSLAEGFDKSFKLLEGDQPINGQWGEEGLKRLLGDIDIKGEKEVGERRPAEIRGEYVNGANGGNGTNRDYGGQGGYGYGGQGGHRGDHAGYRGNAYRGRGGFGSAERGRGRGRGNWRGGYVPARGMDYRPRPPFQGYPQPSNGGASWSGQQGAFRPHQGLPVGPSASQPGFDTQGYRGYRPAPDYNEAP